MAVAGSLLAKAENETFPELGRTYNVSFAENAQKDNGQIKVIRKGEGSWILVEYTFQTPPPRQRVVQGGTPPSAPVEAKSITKKLWLNTHWIVSASEPEPEKK